MNKASAELILRGLENFANSMSKVADRKQKDKESQRQQANADRSFEYAKGRDSVTDAQFAERMARAAMESDRSFDANQAQNTFNNEFKMNEAKRQQGNLNRNFDYGKGRDSASDALAREQIERAIAQNNRTTASNAGRSFVSNPGEFAASASLGAYNNLDPNMVEAATSDAMNNYRNALNAQQASATQQAQAQQASATQKQNLETLKTISPMLSKNPEMAIALAKILGLDLSSLGATSSNSNTKSPNQYFTK